MSDPQTKPIRDLVQDVLRTQPSPLTENIIDDVLLAIESDRQRRSAYDGLCEQFGKALTNQMIGRWTKSTLGWSTVNEVDSKKNTLSKNYSVLMPATRKLNAEERRTQAGKEVFDFYKTYAAALDRAALLPLKDVLVERVFGGDPVEDAFLSVMLQSGLPTAALEAAIAGGPGAQ